MSPRENRAYEGGHIAKETALSIWLKIEICLTGWWRGWRRLCNFKLFWVHEGRSSDVAGKMAPFGVSYWPLSLQSCLWGKPYLVNLLKEVFFFKNFAKSYHTLRIYLLYPIMLYWLIQSVLSIFLYQSFKTRYIN
jgi:hypothetical protein